MYKMLLLILGLSFAAPCFALKPSKEYVAIPDTLKLPYEKNTITTADGAQLRSWTLFPEKAADYHTTLVMAYADAGNMSWWLSYAAVLSQMGYTVVMFDYRGFGDSSPFAIDSKMLYYNEFAVDLVAVTQFARNKYPQNKTGIWAFSMGTIAATIAAQSIKPDFIIGDSYVTDPQRIKAFYAREGDEVLLPAGAADYGAALKKLKLPMLIFSGTGDEVTPGSEIQKLKKINPAVSVVSYDGGHMQGFSIMSKGFPGSEYVASIGGFLNVH